MKVIFNPDIKASLSIDENENVRDIIHSQEYWKSNKQKPLDVAVDYLQNVSHILKISKESLKNIHQNVSFDEPKKQDIEYRLLYDDRCHDYQSLSFKFRL